MNFKQLSRIGIAAMLLVSAASCSSDVELNKGNDLSQPVADGQNVVSFVIRNAIDVQTRADETADDLDKFEIGKGNESEIKNVTLVFFKANGDFFSAATPEFTADKDYTPEHTQEKLLEAQVKLTIKEGVRPKYVLCVINGVDKPYDQNGNTINELSLTQNKPTMTTMLNSVGAFEVELDASGKTPKEPLMMSNSSYIKFAADGTESLVNVTEIPEKAFITADERRDETTGKYYDAEGNEVEHEKVHIDVERINSRIHLVSELDQPERVKPTEVSFDGEIVKIYPKVLAVEITQRTKKSYLVKSLEGNESYDVMDWKSKLYPRSYWATAPALVAWNATGSDGKFLDDKSDYYYKTFDQMENNVDKEKEWMYYPQENTSDLYTAVIVKAILCDEKGEPMQDLIDVTGTRKFFITMDAYRKTVANELIKLGLTFHKPGADGSTVESNDWAPMIDLRRDENPDGSTLGVVPFLNYGNNPDKINEDDLNTAVEALKKFDPVLCYKEGMCFYSEPILHDLLHNDESGNVSRKKGLVRNHAYEVTLKTIKGLGSPIYDPDQIIIPAKPDEIVELEAEIHPLKWKTVHQDVDLK